MRTSSRGSDRGLHATALHATRQAQVVGASRASREGKRPQLVRAGTRTPRVAHGALSDEHRGLGALDSREVSRLVSL
jgi:hypothetical protein